MIASGDDSTIAARNVEVSPLRTAVESSISMALLIPSQLPDSNITQTSRGSSAYLEGSKSRSAGRARKRFFVQSLFPMLQGGCISSEMSDIPLRAGIFERAEVMQIEVLRSFGKCLRAV